MRHQEFGGNGWQGTAMLSDDGARRHLLTRTWDAKAPPLAFAMLNPSTADAIHDDPTVRRCMGFARSAGAGGILVVNLFSVRRSVPKPASSWTREDMGALEGWDLADNMALVCAWGAGAPLWAVREACGRFARGRQLWCLGTTAAGAPRHPLYVPGVQGLEKWTAP